MARGYGDDTNRDRWRDEDRERSSYSRDRDEDRGFFERAGEHFRSWFSDDDDDRGPGRDYQRDTSWNRNQEMSRSGMHGSSWDRDQNRSQRSSWDNDQNRSSRGQAGSWSGGSPSDQSRTSGGNTERNRGSGQPGRSGYGHSGSSWDRDQGRGGYGQPSGSWASSSDRDSSRSSGFGGFRDEGDFRGQHRRDHPQSWGEANRGENESEGDSGMGGKLGGFGNQRFGSSEHDHYRNWRDREMSKLDRDYDDYCREREHQFNQDFDSWRRNRQSQSQSASSSGSSPGADFGTASNAGVGTTTASMTGTGGPGTANVAATGVGGSIQADTTPATETADAGSETGGGGRSGSRSRS